MIKGVIFDYGGTIDSRGEHWSWIIRRGWESAGLTVDLDTFRDCYVYAERYLATHHVIEPQDDFRVLLYKKAVIELERLSEISPDKAQPRQREQLANAIADYCDAHARQCVERARPSLQALHQRLPMVLVSNFYGNVDSVLRAYDLRQYFQGVIESAVVGVRKPDARIFRLGVVALGLQPDEVAVIGDSLKKDILPAESLGCRTFWIKGRGWTQTEDEATHPSEVENLEKAAEAILTQVNV